MDIYMILKLKALLDWYVEVVFLQPERAITEQYKDDPVQLAMIRAHLAVRLFH